MLKENILTLFRKLEWLEEGEWLEEEEDEIVFFFFANQR